MALGHHGPVGASRQAHLRRMAGTPPSWCGGLPHGYSTALPAAPELGPIGTGGIGVEQPVPASPAVEHGQASRADGEDVDHRARPATAGFLAAVVRRPTGCDTPTRPPAYDANRGGSALEPRREFSRMARAPARTGIAGPSIKVRPAARRCSPASVSDARQQSKVRFLGGDVRAR